MSERTRDILREHEYDGIQEYDNPTPGWWNLILIGTFVFSIVYFLYFHMSTISKSVAAVFVEDVAADVKLRFAEIGELKPDAATIVAYTTKAEWVSYGGSVFKAQCVSCHGTEGAGVVGPNLTDNVYKNVKKVEDLARVVSDGAGNGAMPAWKTKLHPNDIVLVSAYVATLRGKNIAGRAAEGDAIPPWPSVTK